MVSEKTMQAAVSSRELLVLHGADGLVEGGGARQVGDRQVHEDHLGHCVVSSRLGFDIDSAFSYKKQL